MPSTDRDSLYSRLTVNTNLPENAIPLDDIDQTYTFETDINRTALPYIIKRIISTWIIENTALYLITAIILLKNYNSDVAVIMGVTILINSIADYLFYTHTIIQSPTSFKPWSMNYRMVGSIILAGVFIPLTTVIDTCNLCYYAYYLYSIIIIISSTALHNLYHVYTAFNR